MCLAPTFSKISNIDLSSGSSGKGLGTTPFISDKRSKYSSVLLACCVLLLGEGTGCGLLGARGGDIEESPGSIAKFVAEEEESGRFTKEGIDESKLEHVSV